MLDYLFVVGCKHGDVPEDVRQWCAQGKVEVGSYYIVGNGRDDVDLSSIAWTDIGVTERTNICVLAHGSARDGQQHMIWLHRSHATPTIDVVRTLCELRLGRGANSKPVRRTGFTMVCACHVGVLADELARNPGAGAESPIIVYGRQYSSYIGEDVSDGARRLLDLRSGQVGADYSSIVHLFLAVHAHSAEEMTLVEPGFPSLKMGASTNYDQLLSGDTLAASVERHCGAEDARKTKLDNKGRAAVTERNKQLRAASKAICAQLVKRREKEAVHYRVNRNLDILAGAGELDAFRSFVQSIPANVPCAPASLLTAVASSLRPNADIARYLLREGYLGKDNDDDDDYQPPITAAAESGNLTFLDVLLSEGANASACRKSDRRSALMMASKRGQIDIVRRLCQRDVDPGLDLQDMTGKTALTIAVERKSLPIVTRLLERGANPGSGDHGSALWHAVAADVAEETTDLTTADIAREILTHNPPIPQAVQASVPRNFVVQPGVVLYPSYGPVKTALGQGSTVGQDSTIKSGCTIGVNARIQANVIIEAACTIGSGFAIGSGSFVGIGVDIGDGVRVGNNTAILSGSSLDAGTIVASGVRINRNVVVPRGVNHRPTEIDVNAIIEARIVLRSNPEGNKIKANWLVTSNGIFSHDGGARGALIFETSSPAYQRVVAAAG